MTIRKYDSKIKTFKRKREIHNPRYLDIRLSYKYPNNLKKNNKNR